MRTEQIKYFLVAAETGSFTKAAEKLDMQQPSLREAITNLEMELGAPLFIRSKRGITLSEHGKYCLPLMQNYYSSYEKMKSGMIHEKQMALHILADYSFDVYSASFYNIIQRKYPSRDVRISTAPDLEYIINSLMQDKIKLGFAIVPKIELEEGTKGLADSLLQHSLEKSLVSSMRLGVLFRSSHPLAQKKRITLNDVLNYPIVCSNRSFPAHKIIKQTQNQTLAEPIIMNSWKLLENYLKTSDAITFIPKYIREKRDDLSFKMIEKSALVVEQYAVYKRERNDEEITDCINTMKLIIDSYRTE